MANEGTGSTRPGSIQLRARRSPRLIALGVLCVVLGALAAVALYSMSITTTSVVSMAHELQRGDKIVASDLTVVQVPGSLARGATPADEIDSLVGNTALRDLPQGSLPHAGLVGERRVPQGHSLVGLRLEPGRIPSTSLVPGSPVVLVSVTEEGDPAAVPATLATAPVLEQHGTFYLVDVVVPDVEAPRIANLAALNTLALVAGGDL